MNLCQDPNATTCPERSGGFVSDLAAFDNGIEEFERFRILQNLIFVTDQTKRLAQLLNSITGG